MVIMVKSTHIHIEYLFLTPNWLKYTLPTTSQLYAKQRHTRPGLFDNAKQVVETIFKILLLTSISMSYEKSIENDKRTIVVCINGLSRAMTKVMDNNIYQCKCKFFIVIKWQQVNRSNHKQTKNPFILHCICHDKCLFILIWESPQSHPS